MFDVAQQKVLENLVPTAQDWKKWGQAESEAKASAGRDCVRGKQIRTSTAGTVQVHTPFASVKIEFDRCASNSADHMSSSAAKVL